VHFEKRSARIRDLDIHEGWTFPPTDSNQPGALTNFLKQFHSINGHWGERQGIKYHKNTEEVITACAKIQEKIVEVAFSKSVVFLATEEVLIASTLRLLAISLDIAGMSSVLSVNIKSEEEQEFLDEISLGPMSKFWDNPSVELSLLDANHCPVNTNGNWISKMVQNIVQPTQQLLLRQRPHDWPIILCVLFLLQLIVRNMGLFLKYVQRLDNVLDLNSIWEDLSEMFAFCAAGHHPLVEVWSASEYRDLLSGEDLPVQHFKTIRSLWVRAGMSTYHVNAANNMTA